MEPVNKVWLYIVRRSDAEPELLVFEHTHTDAGIQIPAGTVEPGEALTDAAHRELLEEAGMSMARLTPFGKVQREWNGEWVHAHWYCGYAPDDAPDEWQHHVTGSGQDNGMVFRCYWLPRQKWDVLFGDFKCANAALAQWTRQKISMETK